MPKKPKFWKGLKPRNPFKVTLTPPPKGTGNLQVSGNPYTVGSNVGARGGGGGGITGYALPTTGTPMWASNGGGGAGPWTVNSVPQKEKPSPTPFPINTPLRQAAWTAARLAGDNEFERIVATVKAEANAIAERLYSAYPESLISVKGHQYGPHIQVTVRSVREKLILPGVTKFKTNMRAVTYGQNFITGEFNWEAICNKAWEHAQYLKAREERVAKLKSIFPDSSLVKVTEGGGLIIELHPENEKDAVDILGAIKRAMGQDEEKIYKLGQLEPKAK